MLDAKVRTSTFAQAKHFSKAFCMISTGSKGRRCLPPSDPRFHARAAHPGISSSEAM